MVIYNEKGSREDGVSRPSFHMNNAEDALGTAGGHFNLSETI